MTVALVHPLVLSTTVASALDARGVEWKAVDHLDDLVDSQPDEGWHIAVVSVDDDAERAFRLLRELRADRETEPQVLVLVSADMLPELNSRTDLFDDFCLTPFHPVEFEARLDHMISRTSGDDDANIISYGPLSLNVETYQAVIEERSLDLTYMEYELLRFLAAAPGKVFSREVLLSSVWGYDYYGGARTVDVHIRRLRSKLGEEHASLITTVRSVGYRFGQARWN